MKKLLPLLIPFLGIFFGLSLLEIGVRIAGIAKPHQAPFKSDRPERHYFDERSGTNRDYKYSEQKPEHTYRIVVVGDSFTFGFGVAFGDTFSKQLERLLNLNKEQPKVEVINLGVPGLSTKQEAPVIKKALETFHPDLVILQITLNDPELRPYEAPRGAITDSAGSYVFNYGIFKYWKSAAFIYSRIENTRSHQRYLDYFKNLWITQDSLQNFTSGVTEIQQGSEIKHVPVVGVVFPLFSFPLNDKYPFFDAHKTAQRILEEHNIQSLDLFPSFKGMDTNRLQAAPGADPHPSEIAHRIAAEEILRWFKEKTLLPSEVFPKLSATKRDDVRRF